MTPVILCMPLESVPPRHHILLHRLVVISLYIKYIIQVLLFLLVVIFGSTHITLQFYSRVKSKKELESILIQAPLVLFSLRFKYNPTDAKSLLHFLSLCVSYGSLVNSNYEVYFN